MESMETHPFQTAGKSRPAGRSVLLGTLHPSLAGLRLAVAAWQPTNLNCFGSMSAPASPARYRQASAEGGHSWCRIAASMVVKFAGGFSP
jgi:hypothetical protein